MNRKTIFIVLAIVVVGFLIWNSRSDYRAFDAQREDWHRRCDAYLAPNEPDAEHTAACQREAAELLAYAKQKGWAK
jgi:hypothetical protein